MKCYRLIKKWFLCLLGAKRKIIDEDRDTIYEIISLTLLVSLLLVFIIGWLIFYVSCIINPNGEGENVFLFFMITSLVMLLTSIAVSVIGLLFEKTTLQIFILKVDLIVLIWAGATLIIGKWVVDIIDTFTGHGMGG
ncbi:MAG: hypothetical protein IKR58_06125 [Lachnospiraceae bacterium]|nr:hypothetical protein [Lachnospiraceae bacterium]